MNLLSRKFLVDIFVVTHNLVGFGVRNEKKNNTKLSNSDEFVGCEGVCLQRTTGMLCAEKREREFHIPAIHSRFWSSTSAKTVHETLCN